MQNSTLQNHVHLSGREEEIGRMIVHCAYKVYAALGPGLTEKVYTVFFIHQLRKAGLAALSQIPIPVEFDGEQLDVGFRADVIVEGLVLCELRAVNEIHPLFIAQTRNHMKLANLRMGFLINFNVLSLRDGIARLVA